MFSLFSGRLTLVFTGFLFLLIFQYFLTFLTVTSPRIFVFFLVVSCFALEKRVLRYVSNRRTLLSLHGNSGLRLKKRRPRAYLLFFCFQGGTLFFGGFLFLHVFPILFDLFGQKPSLLFRCVVFSRGAKIARIWKGLFLR